MEENMKLVKQKLKEKVDTNRKGETINQQTEIEKEKLQFLEKNIE